MAWNCRGTGLSRTVHELSALVRANNLSLLFLCETHNSASRVANLRWRLGLKHCIAVDSDGRSGGLALFWHESVEVKLMEKNFRYIDVSTRLSSTDPWFRITFVYGEPRTELRRRMWMPYGASGLFRLSHGL
jgi:hypothetical protein